MTTSDPVGTGEAARALKISRATLARWASAGYVTPVQRTVGGHLRWDLEQLRREIATLTDPGTPDSRGSEPH